MILEYAIELFDVVDFCLEHGGQPVKHNEYVLTCPTCNKEKLSVNVDKKTWHCWVCEQYGPPDSRGFRQPLAGAGGLVDLVRALYQVSARDAVGFIMERAQSAPTPAPQDIRLAPRAPETYAPVPVAIPAPPHSISISGTLPFMQARGILPEDVLQFRLWICTGGRYANRMVFPVFEDTHLVYYQARAMWDPIPGEPYIKCLNPPRDVVGGVTSAQVLMNLDVARQFPRVAIVEGPVDCVHAGPDAVATFGKRLHEAQLAKLRLAGVRAIDFMWDGPSPSEPHGALPEMLQTAPQLAPYFDVRVVQIPQGDPGDYSREALHAMRAQARPWAAF